MSDSHVMTEPAVAAPTNESRTVLLAQQGNLEAREELALSCRQQAYLFALQLTGHPDDAMDVAQDAMVRFFRSLGRFDSSRPVRPWLLRIVRNLIRDRARRRRVRKTEPIQRDDDVLVFEPRDRGPSPEAVVSRRELQAIVWCCLQDLPPRYREVLILRDYQDLSYAEIATTLRIPRGTVMSRLHRARKMLCESVRRQTEDTREVAHV